MNTFIEYMRAVFRGETIYRILFHRAVARACRDVTGTVLDIAGGNNARYYTHLPSNIDILRTNRDGKEGIDQPVDFNKPLPFEDDSADAVLLFNALYIVRDPVKLFEEFHRVLRLGGSAYISSPFIANEMPDPDDFRRLTKQGILTLAQTAGFTVEQIEIKSFGERFTSATYLLNPFLLFNVIRFFVYGIALGLDRIIPKRITDQHPVPLGYFVILRK